MPKVPSHPVLPSLRLQFEALEERERAGIATGGSTLTAFNIFYDKIYEISRPGTVRGRLTALKQDFDISARRNFNEAIAKMYNMLDIIDRSHSELGISFSYLNTLFTDIMTGANKPRATNLNKRLASFKYGYTPRKRKQRRNNRRTRRDRR